MSVLKAKRLASRNNKDLRQRMGARARTDEKNRRARLQHISNEHSFSAGSRFLVLHASKEWPQSSAQEQGEEKAQMPKKVLEKFDRIDC